MTAETLARQVLTAGFNAATPAALATAVNTWLAGAGEKRLLGIQYQSSAAGDHNALLLYTE